jgi:ribulose-phosphate 3-epimerase
VIGFSPSLASADWWALDEVVGRLERVAISSWHVDIEDGSFVPTMTFGPRVIGGLRRRTGRPIAVHLQVREPGRWLRLLVGEGADVVYLHGTGSELSRLLGEAGALGLEAGVAVRYGAPLAALLPAMEVARRVLVVSSDPEGGDRRFEPDAWRQIAALVPVCRQRRLPLAVDGAVTAEMVPRLAAAGVDECVVGRALFRAASIETGWAELQGAAAGPARR